MNTTETEISQIGEFGLIKRLTDGIAIYNSSTIKGVGDDCAVLNYDNNEILVTTDLLIEGVHFDLTYVPLKHLGYKSAIVNFSDIYAMNGTPKQIVVSLGISKRFTVEHIEALYSGIKLACEIYGVDLVGGDTTASRAGLTISITCIMLTDFMTNKLIKWSMKVTMKTMGAMGELEEELEKMEA